MIRRWIPVLMLALAAVEARADFRLFQAIPADRAIQGELQSVAEATLQEFAPAGLKPENFALTLIDLSGPGPRRASYHGETPFYPASVVKLFYLAYAHHLRAEGKLRFDAGLTRALRDMIVISSNDATGYVVDRITGTTSGPELSPHSLRRFAWRRRVVNRWLQPMGYDVNAISKTFCEDVYGRDLQLLGPNREFRNRFNSDSFAAMLLWIARRQAVSEQDSDEMLALLRRSIPPEVAETPDEQVVDFTGAALPAGSKEWSKAGWTSEVWHDVAYVELPNGHRYVLAVMTRGTAQGKAIMAAVSKRIVEMMSR